MTTAANELALLTPTRPGLLAELSPDGGVVTLADHRRRYPVPPGPGARPRPDLIEITEQSGLLGHGGAGFPTGRKMRSVAAGSKRAVVVANATEGEPTSGKDRLLLSRHPHLVIDGALWAAAAVGADRVVICVKRTNTGALDALERAVAERARPEPTALQIEISDTPPRYVAGEESALVNFVNNGVAKPTPTPPRPYQRGVDGRPTLILNVETLAHLTQLQTRGVAWFRQAGTHREPGTALFSVSGAVAQPGVVEAPIGTPIGEILSLAGGATQSLQAVLVGGFFGTWIRTAHAVDAPCSRAGLAPLGASPGAGIIVALPTRACGLLETARVLSWYATQSAGQCGPCVHGLADLAGGMAAIRTANATSGDVDRILGWAAQIEGRGGCRHPDGAVRLLRSAIDVFASDLAAHVHGDPCSASSAPPTLPVPAPPTASTRAASTRAASIRAASNRSQP